MRSVGNILEDIKANSIGSDGTTLGVMNTAAYQRIHLELLCNIQTLLQDLDTRLRIEQRTPEAKVPEGIKPREDFTKPPTMTKARKLVKCGYKADGSKSTTFEGCGKDIYWNPKEKTYRNADDDTPHRCRQ